MISIVKYMISGNNLLAIAIQFPKQVKIYTIVKKKKKRKVKINK